MTVPLIFIACFLFFLIIFLGREFYKKQEYIDALLKDRSRLISSSLQAQEKVEELEACIKKLEVQPNPKEVLTIDAQQILHDLTREGQTILRITPLSPADVMWRSPR